MKTPLFNEEEIRRYDRHLLLPSLGEAGQARLKASRVLVVGAGGLGSPVALYLAAAGVGVIGLVDSDVVELSNLQRQILHRTADLGQKKVVSAGERVTALNPHVAVELFPERLDRGNAKSIFRNFDVVVGCVDNFVARYVINEGCVALGLVNIFASVARLEGQASVFSHQGGPCYRCFFREPPPEDWTPGDEDKSVLSSVPGIIGCIQATETIKLLAGVGTSLSGRLLLMDGLTMRFREIAIIRDPHCPVCGAHARNHS